MLIKIHRVLHLHLTVTCLLVLPSLASADITATSNITQVTVYPDSARITRTATLQLPAGESKLILPGLPLQMDTTSLRVSGESSADVTLGSVQMAEQVNAEVVQERERTLRDEIKKWQEKRQEVVDAKTRAEQQLAFIRATGLPHGDKDNTAGNPLPLEQWRQAWQVLEVATADSQAKARAASTTLQEFDQGLEQLNQQLQQIAIGETSSNTASLFVTAAQAGELALTLHYQIGNASWTPVYDAELDSVTGKLQLKSQAQIQQITGEDWHNVKANLSTLRPNSQPALPVMDSWVVSLLEPNYYATASAETRGGMLMAEPAMEMEAADMAAPAPAPMQPAARKAAIRLQQSSLVSSEYNAEYQVPGELTLNSGSDSRRLTLETHAFDSELSLHSAPRIDPRAILQAEAAYSGSAPLIPGPVALYRDGNFIGASQLDALQTGEKLKLSFGEDDHVKIDFQPVPEKTSSKGLLNTRKSLERHYSLSVSNQHTDKRTITLYDTIPTANTDEISVSLSGDQPSLRDVDDKKGVMAWIRDLSASETAKLEYGYAVSYPEDKSLSGL